MAFQDSLCAGLDRSRHLRAQSPQIPETNPFSSDADIQQGAALFQTHCSYCHGSSGEGGRGADLTAGIYRRGGRDPELYASIRFGIPGSEMGPVRVTDDEVWKMVAFVKRIGSQGLLEKAPGDPAAGHAVYQKSGCGTATGSARMAARSARILPDIGRRRGLKFLAESLAKPEADIPISYRGVQVVLKSGQTVSGIRLNRDDLSIQLRDTRDNLRSFLMENVQEVRYDKPSLMPAYASMNPEGSRRCRRVFEFTEGGAMRNERGCVACAAMSDDWRRRWTL